MGTPRSDVGLTVDAFSAREVPDGRTRVCDLSVSSEGCDTVVTGTVSTHDLARRLFTLLREVPDVDRAASSVRVLSDVASDRTVTDTAVPVRSDPDQAAEQATQLLYGAEVVAYDADGEWRRVTAPDGYVGWAAAEAIASAESLEANAVLRANVELDDGTFLPIGTPGEAVAEDDSTVEVRFRSGETATVPAESLSRPSGLPSGQDILDIARQFAGTEYEWGGMTTAGIDCSGLVWVSYRVFGIELPRDTDQQQTVGVAVPRDELRPGDLLFFPGHVAISTGGSGYVHAHGSSGGFVESSLDPDDEGYLADLDDGLTCCRRLLPEN
ncbi:MAG: C40 family peptidase [Halolamina sp.]|uniref:C40 family peptidase n=1 Tax=Halolamina sp. TaxID=1940283 RepID=UPI002FC370C9